MHVAVIGAGIVGACCAVECARDGHQVTLIEPHTPGGEHAASYGNGAWISPASVVPVSMPGLWKKIPGYLLDPAGPVTLRWRALPALLPWLARFLLAGCSVARVEATAAALAALLRDAPERHRALALAAGVPASIVSRGLLYAYADRQAFGADALAWRLRRDNGVAWRECEAAELRERLPMLAPRYRFGAMVESGAHCRDPAAYTRALVEHAVYLGAHRVMARATGFAIKGGRLAAVLTDDGRVDCERAVIATGISAAPLARQVGDRVPLQSERGYHVVIARPGFELPFPVMPADGKMANTPTDQGLRLAGQVELASVDAPPDWRRAERLLQHALATYPSLREVDTRAGTRRWMGHRPSTPDGLPVLGPASACPDVLHAFGHGHVGFACAPISGRIVAAMIGAIGTVVDPHPYRAGRFA